MQFLHLFSDNADTIDPHNITVDTTSKQSDDGSSHVYIQWTDPPSPNGLIVLYDIELVKADVANVSASRILLLLFFASADHALFWKLHPQWFGRPSRMAPQNLL